MGCISNGNTYCACYEIGGYICLYPKITLTPGGGVDHGVMNLLSFEVPNIYNYGAIKHRPKSWQ